MKIELANLSEGRGTFVHVYEPAELDVMEDRLALVSPARVEGQVKRSGNDAFVEGRIDADVEVECDRCLQPVKFPVRTEFAVAFITEREYEQTQAAELTADDMSVSVFDGESIDIDEVVREQVLLAVPARALCNDNCKGMCANCGADLNLTICGCDTTEVDPRWETLKKLKNLK